MRNGQNHCLRSRLLPSGQIGCEDGSFIITDLPHFLANLKRCGLYFLKEQEYGLRYDAHGLGKKMQGNETKKALASPYGIRPCVYVRGTWAGLLGGATEKKWRILANHLPADVSLQSIHRLPVCLTQTGNQTRTVILTQASHKCRQS